MNSDRVCLWDTKKRGGRPDTMKLLKEIYESWNAEGGSSARKTSGSISDSYFYSGVSLPQIILETLRLCRAARMLESLPLEHCGIS